MFQLMKDFLEWRRNFKPVKGKPISVNLRANSPASIARHLGRVLRILQVLQNPNIDEKVRKDLEREFNQRKASLAVIGTVLPDTIYDIEQMYNNTIHPKVEESDNV